MNITIIGRKCSPRDAFKEKAERKLAKVDRFFTSEADAKITATVEKSYQTVEITVNAGGMVFRAQEKADTIDDALDRCVDNLIRRIRKNKTKLEKRLKDVSFDSFTPEEDVAEETVADIIADRLFQAKQLGTNDLQGDQVLGLFEEIFKRSNRFTKSLQDNGLGFQKYMRNLLDENAGTMERNMRISNLVQQLISDGKIRENC